MSGVEQIVKKLDWRCSGVWGLAGGCDNNQEMSESDDAERPERLEDTARDLPVGRENQEKPEVLRHKCDKEEGLGNAARVLESAGDGSQRSTRR
eukprot:CAMPEP_0119388740 /NCGR_PEP_ID=MMETSP1334-20130426/106307_1 /TAXON_ID=127549 /ORGANISM="Calcidiscus leptoporus, Strain RCC1130" /LENGTH=93 /DNA_ID=CAMNT_0007410809 /DNA_START=478 /DNA_END=758 /DNA_ORIENTATION=+